MAIDTTSESPVTLGQLYYSEALLNIIEQLPSGCDIDACLNFVHKSMRFVVGIEDAHVVLHDRRLGWRTRQMMQQRKLLKSSQWRPVAPLPMQRLMNLLNSGRAGDTLANLQNEANVAYLLNFTDGQLLPMGDIGFLAITPPDHAPYHFHEREFLNRLVTFLAMVLERLMHEQALTVMRTQLAQEVELRQDMESSLAESQQIANEEITHVLNHDVVTGLANRVAFASALDRQMHEQPHQRFAFALIDLDHFRNINDALGEDIGNQFLQGMAARIQTVALHADCAARTGGDEFAVLISADSDAALLDQLSHLKDSLAAPIPIKGLSLRLSASIGAALFPEHGQQFDDLLQNANLSMNEAKRQGRNRFVLFDDAMRAAYEQRLLITHSLGTALAEAQFSLALQPIVKGAALQSNKFEALIRWRHPDLGLVSPGIFIPIAEELGLINDIGLWVLEQACQLIAQQQQAGHELELSVNVSAYQFRNRDFVKAVSQAIQAHNVPAAALTLEMTESVIMDDARASIDMLKSLKQLGVKVAIDDFGTGYSSLSYLKRFPVDVLKIDRSFIYSMSLDGDYAAITKAVIQLAHNLGLKVVAEGVEEPAQRELLLTWHCDMQQGFYFARPFDSAQLTDYLTAEQP